MIVAVVKAAQLSTSPFGRQAVRLLVKVGPADQVESAIRLRIAASVSPQACTLCGGLRKFHRDHLRRLARA